MGPGRGHRLPGGVAVRVGSRAEYEDAQRFAVMKAAESRALGRCGAGAGSITQLEDGSCCAEVRGVRLARSRPAQPWKLSFTEEVVEEWILVRVARGLDIPALVGA